jgi:hypothetical protein
METEMTVDMQPLREHERTDHVPEASGMILVLGVVVVLVLLALLAM